MKIPATFAVSASLSVALASALACGQVAGPAPGGVTSSVDAGSADASSPEAGEGPDARPTTPCSANALVVREALPASAGDNPIDPLGYLPFAEDGCGLVYVSGQDRRLYRVAFDTGERLALETLSRPTRPSARDGLVAWEAIDEGGRGVVRVRVNGAEPITIPGAYTRALEPRVGVDAVVYTFTRDDPESETADMDVAVYTPSTRTVTVVAEGPGQQRFGAVAKGRVAFTDFSEDPTGAFSRLVPRAADVVVVDLASGTRTTRRAPGKQAFPQLSDDGTLLYTDFGEVHPEPKTSSYAIKLGRFDAPVGTDRTVHERATIGSATAWIQPALTGGFALWVEDDTRLLRRPATLDSPATLVATHPAGFVGASEGDLAAYVAARSQTAPGQVFVESRALR